MAPVAHGEWEPQDECFPLTSQLENSGVPEKCSWEVMRRWEALGRKHWLPDPLSLDRLGWRVQDQQREYKSVLMCEMVQLGIWCSHQHPPPLPQDLSSGCSVAHTFSGPVGKAWETVRLR